MICKCLFASHDPYYNVCRLGRGPRVMQPTIGYLLFYMYRNTDKEDMDTLTVRNEDSFQQISSLLGLKEDKKELMLKKYRWYRVVV